MTIIELQRVNETFIQRLLFWFVLALNFHLFLVLKEVYFCFQVCPFAARELKWNWVHDFTGIWTFFKMLKKENIFSFWFFDKAQLDHQKWIFQWEKWIVNFIIYLHEVPFRAGHSCHENKLMVVCAVEQSCLWYIHVHLLCFLRI